MTGVSVAWVLLAREVAVTWSGQDVVVGWEVWGCISLKWKTTTRNFNKNDPLLILLICSKVVDIR